MLFHSSIAQYATEKRIEYFHVKPRLVDLEDENAVAGMLH
jgi:hypothetical protein